MRDDFTGATKDLLAKRVGYRCSNPSCRQSTSGPQDNPAGVINVGVAAHVTAASLNGPRNDASLTSEQRCSAENGIWVCQTCAKLIDNDERRYSVAALEEWKRSAELAAARELEQRRSAPSEEKPDQSLMYGNSPGSESHENDEEINFGKSLSTSALNAYLTEKPHKCSYCGYSYWIIPDIKKGFSYFVNAATCPECGNVDQVLRYYEG